ncbi:MAG: hypothetical protein HYZ15_04625 [Sphingobacteriales bacterium]|nr:hypothetical protein [Sphingobacteriales bacterium]
MPSKGKQQVLFGFLPGKVFDYLGHVFARVSRVTGDTSQRLNQSHIIRKVSEHARTWNEEYRRGLSDAILNNEASFFLVDPNQVESELFPLVFECTNIRCQKVYTIAQSGPLPRTRTCTRCNHGKLQQLRFIKVHKCGNLEPLTPPYSCSRCHSRDFAFDRRGSERIMGFKWRCLSCGNTTPVLGFNCQRCVWPGGTAEDQKMQIEVFRAGKNFYVHNAVLINIPERKYSELFRLANWHEITTAKYLALPAIKDSTVIDYVDNLNSKTTNSAAFSTKEFDDLMSKLSKGEITVPEFTARTAELRQKVQSGVADFSALIPEQSGVPMEIWERAKHDLLDAVIPFEIGAPSNPIGNANDLITSIGLSRLTLIDDFPIVTASYAFSRTESKPYGADGRPLCYLNPFPNDNTQGGKLPIYVNRVQADALFLSLDFKKVIKWIELNGYSVVLPPGTDQNCMEKAFFVNLFYRIEQGSIIDVNVNEKIFGDQPLVRMTLGLLHTYSHLAIKNAALLCGLDKTSITEFVIPKSLSFVIYCNNMFGSTIGAFTALFEQSLTEWLNQVERERSCVYDPVCYDNDANCHSCTHLAETSCRMFNQNLSRVYLFGGVDHELDRTIIGFMDPRVQTTSDI